MVFGINTLLGGPYSTNTLAYLEHIGIIEYKMRKEEAIKMYITQNRIRLPVGGAFAVITSGGKPEIVTLYQNSELDPVACED